MKIFLSICKFAIQLVEADSTRENEANAQNENFSSKARVLEKVEVKRVKNWHVCTCQMLKLNFHQNKEPYRKIVFYIFGLF